MRFAIFFFCGFLASVEAYAIYPDLTPACIASPELCPPCTSEKAGTAKSAIEYVKKATSREGQKELLGEAKSHLKSYAKDKGEDLLKKVGRKYIKEKNEKPISYTRMIKQTTTDLNDINAVKEAFKRYFLYVPSDKEKIQAAYREKREQFVEDTAVELYITAKEMDKELRVQLAQLDLIKECVILGNTEKCQAEGLEQYNCQKDGAEDEMCYRRNMLLVADIYDTIMKNNEYLMAMRAQYEAVRALGDGVKPKSFDKKAKKTSFSIYHEETMNYASQEADEFDDIEEGSLVMKTLPDAKFEFKDNSNSGVETPFDGKEGDMKALGILQDAQERIMEAIESHNLKQQLPSFKNAFDSYHNMEDLHAKATENLQTSQTCVLNYLSKRYADAEKVWLDNCSLAPREGYVCAYTPARSISDRSESEGLYDVMCPNNSTQKCYKLGSSAYGEIGGMSGWLINMYLNAKDELSDSDESSDDYVISSSDSETEEDDFGPGGGSAITKNMKYQVSGNEILVDKYTEEMRKLGQLNLSIGILANDEINKDTNGVAGPSKFNVSTTPFPLWNDQINFYDQYIDGKYANIREYFEKAPLLREILGIGLEMNKTFEYEPERNEQGFITKTVEAIREETEKIISGLLKDTGDSTDGRVEKVKAVLQAEANALNKIKADFHNQLEALDAKRFNLYKQLEDINVNAGNLNDKIEQQNSAITYAEGYNEQAEAAAEMDKKYQTAGNPHKTLAADLGGKINEQNQKEKEAEATRAQAKSELASSTPSRDQILDAIKSIELQMRNIRSAYVLAYYNAERKSDKELDELLEAASKQSSLTEWQIQAFEAINNLTVLSEATKLLEYMRQYAVIQVDEAKGKLDAMKNNGADSLYYAENNDKVVKIHTEMLKKITEPDIEDVISTLGLEGAPAALLTEYAENISGAFAKICDNVSCYKADDRYFVGFIAYEKDLAAPKAAVKFSSAPLREMFTFNQDDMGYVNYFSAKKYKEADDETVLGIDTVDISDPESQVLLVEGSLPESGIEMPEIWKIVLAYRPFVERNIDLDKFLNHGDAESVAVARSGIYPCLSGGQIIDVVPQGDGSVQYARLSMAPAEYGQLPQCQTVTSVGNIYFDTEAKKDFNVIGKIRNALPASAAKASELGNILEFKTVEIDKLNESGLPWTDEFGLNMLGAKVLPKPKMGYLTFRKEFLGAIKFVVRYVESFGDEDVKFNAAYYLNNRILPTNSQFGDYLAKMDIERTALDAVERIRSRLYSDNLDDLVVVNSLYKSFAAMGYDFDRKNFDLSQEAYYKQAENVLNSRKEVNLQKAKALLNGKDLVITLEDFKKRKEDLLRQVALLELDVDEKVAISSNETVEELAEKIKTAKVDTALVDEISKGNDDLESKITNSEPAYCSVYAN